MLLIGQHLSWLEAHACQQYIRVLRSTNTFHCGLHAAEARCRPLNISLTGLKYVLAFNTVLSPRPTFISAGGACVSKISCSAVHQHISLWPEALQAFSADLNEVHACFRRHILAGGACVSTIYSCSAVHQHISLRAFSISVPWAILTPTVVVCAPSLFVRPTFLLRLWWHARLEYQCSICRHLFLLRLWWHGAPWWCSIGRHSCAPSVSVFHRPFILTPTVVACGLEYHCSIGRYLFLLRL